MTRSECCKILEIPFNASEEEIRKAYRRLAKIWHPDINKSLEATEKFKKINQAYEELTKTKPSSNDDLSWFWNFTGFNPFRYDLNKNEECFSSLTLEFDGQNHLTKDDLDDIVRILRKKGVIVKNCRLVQNF